MSEPSSPTGPVESPSVVQLDSWKEIAAYLNRDVTTVQRWEKREGMPVHRHIHTQRGSVYAIAEELEVWRHGRRLLPGDTERSPSEKSASADYLVPEAKRSPGRIWIWLGLGAAIVLLAAGSALVLRRRLAPTAPGIHAIAVLPLRNLSGDASQDYLADGVTEALIGRLAGLRSLRVISHTSVLRFKDTKASIPEIARTLGVDAVVEGSVVRSGSRVRVTAQLIRGSTDEHFWSETYDRDMRDVLTMEGEIADAVAQRVEITVNGPERQRLIAARTVAPEVYESYLKGMYALQQESGRSSFEESLKQFQSAARLDPTFAPAYLGIAESYSDLGTVFSGASPVEMRPKAIAAVRKALALDPEMAEGHELLAEALQHEWQWREAEGEYQRALELAPNSAGAQAGYADWLLTQGRTEEAVARVQLARELDPWQVDGSEVSAELFMSHRFPEAIRESRSALAVRPNDAFGLFILGFALLGNNQPGDAVPVLVKGLALSHGSPAIKGLLIRAYAHAGRRPDALRLLQQLKRQQRTAYVPAAAFVNAYLGLGDREAAFGALDQAYREKSDILLWIKVHPFFDPLRSDPRFHKLIEQVGLDD